MSRLSSAPSFVKFVFRMTPTFMNGGFSPFQSPFKNWQTCTRGLFAIRPSQQPLDCLEHLCALGIQRGNLVHDFLGATVGHGIATVRILHGEIKFCCTSLRSCPPKGGLASTTSKRSFS